MSYTRCKKRLDQNLGRLLNLISQNETEVQRLNNLRGANQEVITEIKVISPKKKKYERPRKLAKKSQNTSTSKSKPRKAASPKKMSPPRLPIPPEKIERTLAALLDMQRRMRHFSLKRKLWLWYRRTMLSIIRNQNVVQGGAVRSFTIQSVSIFTQQQNDDASESGDSCQVVVDRDSLGRSGSEEFTFSGSPQQTPEGSDESDELEKRVVLSPRDDEEEEDEGSTGSFVRIEAETEASSSIELEEPKPAKRTSSLGQALIDSLRAKLSPESSPEPQSPQRTGLRLHALRRGETELVKYLRQIFPEPKFAEMAKLQEEGRELPAITVPPDVRPPWQFRPEYCELVIDVLSELLDEHKLSRFTYESFLGFVNAFFRDARCPTTMEMIEELQHEFHQGLVSTKTRIYDNMVEAIMNASLRTVLKV